MVWIGEAPRESERETRLDAPFASEVRGERGDSAQQPAERRREGRRRRWVWSWRRRRREAVGSKAEASEKGVSTSYK